MKKMILLLFLAALTKVNYAQENNIQARVFGLPPGAIARTFAVDLGKGNKVLVDVSGMEVLQRVNADSLVKNFERDIALLKDSLWEEPASKHIYYTAPSSGNNKLRIQQYKPEQTYLVRHGQLSILKLEQDTVTITGMVREGKEAGTVHYGFYRFTFFLNHLDQFAGYAGDGLQQKILETPNGKEWVTGSDGIQYIRDDPLVIYPQDPGAAAPARTINFNLSANLQNYRDYFVPSFSGGVGYAVTGARARQTFSLSAEMLYLFASDKTSTTSPEKNAGRLKAYENTFLVFSYQRGQLQKPTPFPLSFSAGYLVSRGGDYFPKGTLRLGIGKINLSGGKMVIEPVIYSSGFLKGVSPGVRLVVGF